MLICSHTSCISWQNRYTGYLSIVSKYYNQGNLRVNWTYGSRGQSLDGGANARRHMVGAAAESPHLIHKLETAAILEADPADPATHLPDKVTPPNLSRGEKPGRS